MDQTDGLVVAENRSVAPDADKGVNVVGSKAWASRLRHRAKELTAFLETGYMELAHILYQIYDTPAGGDAKKGPALYAAWGYSSLLEYAEKELQINKKRAERLRRIWYVLEIEMKDIDPEIKQRIVNLGFCKVRELIRVLTPRNAKGWVEQAEKLNYFSLQAAVTAEYQKFGAAEKALALEKGKEDEPADPDAQPDAPVEVPEVLTREVFALYPEQLSNVRLAIKKAMELSHSDKKSHNLDLICTDFLATNDFVAGDNDRRLRYIAKMEKVLGVNLVAVDDSGDVLYGIHTLELAAKGGENT
jgi:hypothetical protein